MNFRTLYCFAALAILAGCQTAAAPTPTMHVQASADAFTDELLLRRGEAGYVIVSQTRNMIVLEKTELHDTGTILLFGTGYGPPRIRLTYQIFGAAPLRVQVSGAIIENGGTAFERSYVPAAEKFVREARDEVGRIATTLTQS